MSSFAKRIRRGNTEYFNAGVEVGVQKAMDLLMVAAHEIGILRSPAKAMQLFEKFHELEREYGVAWQGKAASDEAIARIDYVLQKVCGEYFQPFFERNDLVKDWWDGR